MSFSTPYNLSLYSGNREFVGDILFPLEAYEASMRKSMETSYAYDDISQGFENRVPYLGNVAKEPILGGAFGALGKLEEISGELPDLSKITDSCGQAIPGVTMPVGGNEEYRLGSAEMPDMFNIVNVYGGGNSTEVESVNTSAFGTGTFDMPELGSIVNEYKQ